MDALCVVWNKSIPQPYLLNVYGGILVLIHMTSFPYRCRQHNSKSVLTVCLNKNVFLFMHLFRITFFYPVKVSGLNQQKKKHWNLYSAKALCGMQWIPYICSTNTAGASLWQKAGVKERSSFSAPPPPTSLSLSEQLLPAHMTRHVIHSSATPPTLSMLLILPDTMVLYYIPESKEKKLYIYLVDKCSNALHV